MPLSMLEKIEEDLRVRMEHYTDSRQPTDDEVRIAWLITRIDELEDQLKNKPIKSEISLNSYPSNYVEEVMPQVIVEVRYRKDYNPNNAFRKEKALDLATKLETFIDKIL